MHQLADLVTQNGTLEYNYDDRDCEYILNGMGDLQLQLQCNQILCKSWNTNSRESWNTIKIKRVLLKLPQDTIYFDVEKFYS